MAAEFILKYKKPGFPKTANTDKGFSTTIEYVGPLAELQAEQPSKDEVWGDYTGVVKSAKLNPLEGTEKAELTVICEATFDQSGDSSFDDPTVREIGYEREWVEFTRSLYEHPAFAIGQGGEFELSSEDLAAIEKWQNNEDVQLKAEYKYPYHPDGGVSDLSPNAKMFVRGLELGQDPYTDYAPVIRKTTNFAKGIPSGADAGLKGGEPEFTGKPEGYEWRKASDRGVKAGGQTRWDQVEEWMGATKVLIDRKNVFWEPPTS
jgi:hypothetical protein